MRLLLAIKSLNVAGGGAERVLVDLANGLTDRGHQVEVLTFDAPGPSFYRLDPRVLRRDLDIGMPGRPTRWWRFLNAIPALRRAVRESRCDLLVAFMHSTYVPLAFALWGGGTRLVVSEHAAHAHFQSRPMQRFLAGIAERLSVGKTVPHPEPEHARGPMPVFVLPNGVDLTALNAVASTLPQEPPVLLCVGRFMEEKNHAELVRAFAQLAAEFPSWTLRLVGDGELRSDLEREVSRLDLTKRVDFAGVSRDMASEYAAASLVVIPSLYESFGMVAVEALASGRPVVAFDGSLGVANIVQHGVNGMLAASAGDRVQSLAAALRTLMEAPGRRRSLGQAGPATVERFSVSGSLDRWENALRQLSSTPMGRP